MAIRITLEDGPDLLIRASLSEVSEALRAALDTNAPITINTSTGQVAINPHRVVLMAEEPDGRGSRAGSA